MSINIQSPEGQKILSDVILLFKKNGNRMTTQQLHQQLPALLDTPLVEDGEDLITAILESACPAETAESESSPALKIFTRIDENTYILDASADTLTRLTEPSDAAKTEADLSERVSDMKVSSETQKTSACSGDDQSDDLHSLEQNLSVARAAVRDAAAYASSLKTQSQEMAEKTAQDTRRQLDSSYQDQLNDLQNRIRDLQKALDEAGKEKNAVQAKADTSLQSASQLNEQLQEALEQKEQIISEYSSTARDNQQQISTLHQAIEEADRQLADAALKAQDSEKEIRTLQCEADSFDQYKTAMADRLQAAADSYDEEMRSMQDQLAAARTDLKQSRSQVSQAHERADACSAEISTLTEKVDTMRTALAQMSSRLDEALQENEKLKKDLTGRKDESDRLAAEYDRTVKSYQEKINALLKKMDAFRSREDALNKDLSSLHDESEKRRTDYQDKAAHYEEEIEALRSRMESDYKKLVEACSRIRKDGQTNDGLRKQLDRGQALMKDLEARLNAALSSLASTEKQARTSQAKADSLQKDVQAFQGQISSDQKTIQTCQQQIDGLRQALADAMNRKAEAQNQAAASEKDIQELQTENKKWKSQIDDLQKQLDQAAAGLVQAQKEAGTSEKRADGLQDALQTLSSEKEGLAENYQKGMESARSKIDSCLTQIDTLKKALLNSEKEKEEARSQMQDVQQGYDSLSEQMESWKDQMNQLQDQLDQTRRKLADAKKETEAASGRADQEAGELRQLKADHQQQTAESAARQNDLQNEIDTLQKQMEALRKALEEAQEAKEQIRSHADDQEAQAALLKKTASDLESQLEAAGIELGKSKKRVAEESVRADQLQSEMTALKDSNDQLNAAAQKQKEASDQHIVELEDEVNTLKKELSSEKKAAQDAFENAKKASLQNAQLKKNIDGLTSEKERIASLYSEDTATLKEVIAKLEDRLSALNTALADAQDHARDADARADNLQKCYHDCVITIRELENLSDRSSEDSRKSLDAIQKELDEAYQELSAFSKARRSVPKQICEISADRNETASAKKAFVYEPDHGACDDEIQMSRDEISRQQEKIDEHEAQMEATDSSIMKAIRQAQINHNSRIIKRENSRISDLEKERMSKKD